jgi:uncharacterized RDD family membrane protein YckC
LLRSARFGTIRVPQAGKTLMTQPAPTLSYAGPQTVGGNCPLCHKRPVTANKKIYQHCVCKKCFYAFANRRQLAYLVDAILMTAVTVPVNLGLVEVLQGMDPILVEVLLLIPGAALVCAFIMKDGFDGGSPGKKLAGIQVIDDRTGQPIGFGQSFKRNSILLFGLIPIVGGFVSLVIIIVIAMQVAKGYRVGDRFAQTRAIWKRYAHLPVFGGNALVCEECGYNLHGNVSGVCPECGTQVSERNQQLLGAAMSAA